MKKITQQSVDAFIERKPFKKGNTKATPKVQVVEKVQFKNGKNK